MFRLEDLTLFVRAAALNSFSDAAREVGVQPAQVSSAIKRLESTLAIRLFARSTRSLRLTPEGEVWLPYARQMLANPDSGYETFVGPGNQVITDPEAPMVGTWRHWGKAFLWRRRRVIGRDRSERLHPTAMKAAAGRWPSGVPAE